jgi:nucleoside-diphosphate-sugar epimerase
VPVPGSCPSERRRYRHPQSPYAVSKTAAIQLAQLYAARYEMRVHCVRPFQFIGPQKFPDVVAEFAKQIAAVEKGMAKELHVGNLEVVRDLLDVREGIRAMWMIAQAGKIRGDIQHLLPDGPCGRVDPVSADSPRKCQRAGAQ